MYIQHDLCQFWCSKPTIFHKSAALLDDADLCIIYFVFDLDGECKFIETTL